MSEVIAVGIIGAIAALSGSLLTNWYNQRTAAQERKARLDERHLEIDARAAERREEHRQWFERSLFEKQLKAIAEGNDYLLRFNDLLNESLNSEAAHEELREVCREARNWYRLNALYLFDGLPGQSDFMGAINAAAGGLGPNVWKQQNDAFKALRERASEIMLRARPPRMADEDVHRI